MVSIGVGLIEFAAGEGAYLTSKMVLKGLAAAWFLAESPTRRSSSVKAT